MYKYPESPRRRHNRSYQPELERNTPVKPHTIHNQDKLKVFIKFKPEPKHPENSDQVIYLNEREIEIKTTLKHRVYKFDHVFSPKQGPREVFQLGCKQIIEYVFTETYEDSHTNNGLIFVYGNTGTGKTYSMGLLDLVEGHSCGLVPDALRYVFSLLKRKSYQQYSVSISFCQIYMDEVYDLLALDNETKLVVREDSKTKEPFLENQMMINVQSVEQAFQIINIGLEKRRVAEQRMNRRSSRGHGVICINVDPNNGQRPGKLCFVDLAGCERLKDSQSKGTTLSQALHINSSLSSLQTLLMNISEQTIRNYRASKLTRLLQPFLQRGRIHLFATTTRDSAGTIQFAKRCKGIRFMERDLRQSVAPIRRSAINQKTVQKWSKEVEELTQFKKKAEEKELKYRQCISGLLHSLAKIAKDLQNCLNHQKGKTKFSFSEIMKNSEVEALINRKLDNYEKKEQSMLGHLLQRLESTVFPSFDFQTNSQIDSLSSISTAGQDFAHEISEQFQGMTALNDYRSIYKKEFFTSQLKLHLLQQRCQAFEDNLHQLTPYMNTNDKRVVRRLKDLGISLQNIENQPHLRNKQMKKERDKESTRKAPLKQHPNVSESPEEENTVRELSSRRRSAIFIDQI